jgi:hypothetical protein
MVPLYTVWVLAVNARPEDDGPMDPICSAINKNGSVTTICDLPHGHTGDHCAYVGATKITWAEEPW